MALQTKIIHVDMDYFYAQVEIRDNPKLKGKPLIISGPPNVRSVICTANYEARELGVHAGMSSTIAFKMYPNLNFVEPNFKKYKEVSEKMHEIFHRYSDIIEPLSLDEAYIDVTENKIGSKSAYRIAKMIQNDIYNELNLTCSVGVSYNKFLAKISSDENKPFGIFVVTPESAQEFINNLAIRKFPGVGKKSVDNFYSFGIYKGKDILEYDKEKLVKLFKKQGESLYYYARGIDNRKVKSTYKRKSFGKEITFVNDIESVEVIYDYIKKVSYLIEEYLTKNKYHVKTIKIKYRYSDFQTYTRSISLKHPTSNRKTIYDTAVELFVKNYDDKPIRLFGVGVQNFVQDDGEVFLEQIYLDIFGKGKDGT